jgi:tRNA-splicing ligase RtcB
MGDSGYVVRGKGSAESINSASHGAGRTMSRTRAFATLDEAAWRGYLEERGIILVGGGLDEAPMAYKPIEEVMARQRDLVDVLGSFTPRIVRMDGGSPRRKKPRKGDKKGGE